jgi:hypothetical protein
VTGILIGVDKMGAQLAIQLASEPDFSRNWPFAWFDFGATLYDNENPAALSNTCTIAMHIDMHLG